MTLPFRLIQHLGILDICEVEYLLELAVFVGAADACLSFVFVSFTESQTKFVVFLAPDNFLKYLLHVPTPQGTNKPSKKQTFWRPFATKDPDSGIPETEAGLGFLMFSLSGHLGLRRKQPVISKSSCETI